MSTKWNPLGSPLASSLDIPSSVRWLAEQCEEEGGQLLIVGGGVRDHLLGQKPTDWDVEVFGVDAEWLESTLKRQGYAHKVGKSFGVYKWTVNGETIDVALPQRANKSELTSDPTLSPHEAARRRDLTINAIGYNPIANQFIDPYDGQKHINAKILHPVNKATFLEDPLRVLRAAQFSARLLFAPSDFLIECGTEADLSAIPSERIRGEFIKLLCDGCQPSLGFELLFRTRKYAVLFPDAPAPNEHALQSLDALAMSQNLALSSKAHRLAAMLSLWVLDFPTHAVTHILTVLDIHSLERLNIRKQVLAVHGCHNRLMADDACLRNLSTTANLDILTSVAGIHRGEPQWASDLKQRAETLNILHQAPISILKGRHLKALGCPPGPHMAPILASAYQKQLDGEIHTEAQAIEFARSKLTNNN